MAKVASRSSCCRLPSAAARRTLLAVYHLANRQCALGDLSGLPALPDHAGVMDVPTAKVAVLDGTAHAPGHAWQQGKQAKQTICTQWGEMAWQLGGAEGFALAQEADANGTSPGKDVLWCCARC